MVIQEAFFNGLTAATFILVIGGALGLSQTSPEYLTTLDKIVKLYVCAFLILRFNPFTKVKMFTPLDKRIAFSAGMLLLTSTFLTGILKNMYDNKTILKVRNPSQ